MNFKFAEQINPFLENLDFPKAIRIAETALKNIPSTTFHAIIHNSLVHHSNDLAIWINNFYNDVSKRIEPKALYFELNEFDINTDFWYIDGFAFSHDGGLNLEDMEWLCDVSKDTMTSEEFIITGFESLQEAFENSETNTPNLKDSKDWCEQLIIARFMELMRSAHLAGKNQKMKWAHLPIYFTEHSYDFIVKSE